jgi:hypothetical protein
MKTISFSLLGVLTLGFTFAAHPQGTAFTYQGKLNDGANPANGQYDFRFKLYVDSVGNTQAGSSYLADGVAVNDGLFTAMIDFGAALFSGSSYWLEVDVKTNGSASYTVLTPLQPLTPTPYAIFANSVSNILGVVPASQLSGVVPSASFSGTYANAVILNNAANRFTGNGSGLTSLNASALTSGTVADARIDTVVARDSEIMPTVLANDGPGSGLNADQLDGLHASSFAGATHTHSGVQYYTIGSEGFVPGSNVDYVNTYGNGGAYILSGTGAMVASVHLPNGAVVTEFKAFFYDNSASDLSISLERQAFTAGYSTQANVTSSGTPGYSSATTREITYPRIDNTSNSYLAYVYSTGWNSSLRVKAVVITYTVDTVP